MQMKVQLLKVYVILFSTSNEELNCLTAYLSIASVTMYVYLCDCVLVEFISM